MLRRPLIAFALLSCCGFLHAQVIGPYQPKKDQTQKKAWGDYDDDDDGSGWFPFSEEMELRWLYEKDYISSVNYSNLSLINDEVGTSNFIEVASIIPQNSRFKLGIGLQMDGGGQDDSSMEAARSIALQKFMNNGGNVSISFERPIYYHGSFAQDGSGFLLLDASVRGFFDIPSINQNVYNPGAGMQLKAVLDWRLMSHSVNERQRGNGIRTGVRFAGIKNLFNSQYETQPGIDLTEFSDIGGVIGEFYLAFAMIEFRYSYIAYSDNDYVNQKDLINFSIIPVRF